MLLSRLSWLATGLWGLLVFACPLFRFKLAAAIIIVAVAAAALALAAVRAAPTDQRDLRRRAKLAMFLSLAPTALTLAAVFILPNLNRAREPENRVLCASNLRQIGQAIAMYASENRGAFPPSLGNLIIHEDITSEVFICPSSSDERAQGAATAQVAAAVDSNPANCSFVYLGAALSSTTVTPQHVIAHDRLPNHEGAGVNVLYGDYSARWLNQAEAKHVLSELSAGHNPPR